MTELVKIDPLRMDMDAINKGASLLLKGELVAFPTETVYGLGANAEDEKAVLKIFSAKGRPSDNPLIVHIAHPEQAELYAREIPPEAKLLMDKYWGGPLTIILKKKKSVPDAVTAGLDTVAVRLPSHPVANALLRACGVGIAAPSANLSGKPSPTVAAHVMEDLNGRVPMIIDGGAAKYGVESTVIDLSTPKPQILRPGAISLEEIKELLPNAVYGGGGEGIPKSPGMKYQHYAPLAQVYMVSDAKCEKLNALTSKETKKTGILALDAEKLPFNADVVLSAGRDNFDYAARLFYLLREFDERGAEVVFAQEPSKEGIGYAVYNRLLKAAGGRVI